MYNCQLCGRVVPANMPLQRVVLETRPRTYLPREKVHLLASPPPKSGRKKKRRARGEWKNDPGGHGCEIVREVAACPACAAGYNVQFQCRPS